MRMIGRVALVALLVWLAALPAQAQPVVTARGAIIVDAETGSVIWEKNADEPLPPASTTKVMTAVLALQSHRLDEQFAVSANASNTPPSKIGLRPGQRVSLHDLLFAVLLKSANDAAVVVAEGVSGSESSFAQQMNLKARVIGAVTTNFENPHGLTEGGHLTTARDLSRIFRYGLGVPGFREVLYTSSAGVEIDGAGGRYTTVRSHNRLLNAPDYQVIGKTGYTRAARRCYVGAAGYGSREVVIALLGSTDLWGDARRMLYYGLQPGRPTPVLTAARTPPPQAAAPIPEAREPEPVAVAAAPPPTAPPPAPAAPQPQYRAPPQPEYRAAPPANYRAAPPPEYRAPAPVAQAEPQATPPPPVRAVPPPSPTPADIARTDAGLAPQAAVDRAARMARAQPGAAPAATQYAQQPVDAYQAPDAAAAPPDYAPSDGPRREIMVDEDRGTGQRIVDPDPEPADDRPPPARKRGTAAAAAGTAAAAGSAARRSSTSGRSEVATRGTTARGTTASDRERASARDARTKTASVRSTDKQKAADEAARTSGRNWTRSRSETRTPTTTARKERDMPRPEKRAADAKPDPKAAKRGQEPQRGATTRGGAKATTTARAETSTKTTKSSSASRKETDKESTSSRASGQKPAKKR